MSQQNGWMTHSISTCASCKQITFINTSHTPGFFRMFCWWLVMEFQNPAPEAGRLLKTAQTWDKQTHSCGGSPPAPAGDSSQAAAALGGAGGGSGSGGGRSDRPQREFQPRAAPGAARAQPGPKERTLQDTVPALPTEALWFLLRKPKWTLSNVNLLCSFKPTLSAVLPGSVFARISKIYWLCMKY